MAGEPVKISVKITDSSGAWFNNQLAKVNEALGKMAQSIKAESQLKAPLSEGGGALRKSVRIVKANKQVSIIYGGGSVAYAGYQERGARYDGTHKVRHYTTSGTGAHYLEEAGKRVTAEGIRRWLH